MHRCSVGTKQACEWDQKLRLVKSCNSNNNKTPLATSETQETQSQEKSIAFNITWERTTFLELNWKKGKKT
jgi:hypothetical protein